MTTTTTITGSNVLGLLDGGGLSNVVTTLPVLIPFLLTIIVHIALALGTYIDAKYMFAKKQGPFLVPPFIWSLAVLVGGILTTVAYWAIHHSTLRPRPSHSHESTSAE